jgi:hypothetical protein
MPVILDKWRHLLLDAMEKLPLRAAFPYCSIQKQKEKGKKLLGSKNIKRVYTLMRVFKCKCAYF